MSSKITTDQDDDRYETEEFYVYVDLDTKLLDNQLTKSNAKVKFLGIDTENPIMQLNNQLFKGNFDSIFVLIRVFTMDDSKSIQRAFFEQLFGLCLCLNCSFCFTKNSNPSESDHFRCLRILNGNTLLFLGE